MRTLIKKELGRAAQEVAPAFGKSFGGTLGKMTAAGVVGWVGYAAHRHLLWQQPKAGMKTEQKQERKEDFTPSMKK